MTMDEALQFLAAAGDKPPMATWDSEDYLWDPQGLVAHQIGEHPVGPCSGMPASPMAAPRTGSQDGEEGPSGRDPSYGDTSGGGARSSKGRFNAPSVKHGNGRPNKCQSDGCDKDLASLTYYHVRNR